MPGDRIRVGIIGANTAGSWGAIAHLPALMTLPDFDVVAVATSRRQTAAETAQHFGIPNPVDPLELTQRPDVDLVVVCVRVPAHHQLVRAAIEAGKHVFCEWPLDIDRTNAQQVRDAAVRKGVRHMVGLQARASAVINHVRDLVAGGYVGRPLACNLLVSREWPSRVPQNAAYLQDRTTGATMLTIIGGHNLDALRYVLGPFRELSATVVTQITEATVVETGQTIARTSPDQTMVNGVLQNGVVVSAHIQGSGMGGSGSRLEIMGSEGTLLVTSPQSLHIPDLSLSGVRGAGPLVDIPTPQTYRTVPANTPAGPPLNVAGLYVALASHLKGTSATIPDFDAAVSLHGLLETIQTASDTGIRQPL